MIRTFAGPEATRSRPAQPAWATVDGKRLPPFLSVLFHTPPRANAIPFTSMDPENPLGSSNPYKLPKFQHCKEYVLPGLAFGRSGPHRKKSSKDVSSK